MTAKTLEASHDSLAVRQDSAEAVRIALERAGIEFTPGTRPV
jgi:hypothetical protein